MYGSSNLIEKYQEQAVKTMSRGELIIKLYDEVIKNLKYASVLFKQNNIPGAKKCTTKCKDILNYLIVILDNKYDLSKTLNKLYSFMLGQIIQTNATGDASHIDGIIPKLQELREAWAEAEKTLRSQGGVNPKPRGTN